MSTVTAASAHIERLGPKVAMHCVIYKSALVCLCQMRCLFSSHSGLSGGNVTPLLVTMTA